ncbi:MAG TPA: putative ABC exporter domain-containing protein, partial [Opitutales bacterium]|nr:putative ABC exporter domain-containing protein [Opitutales bacterium]
MISALVYLQFYQIRNRLATRLRRLKRPKYLVGAVFGAIYMVVYFGWLISAQSHPQGAPTGPLSITDPQASENFGALLFLGAVLLLGWVLPNERAVLAFSEAEINFLFPAPVTRRQLIQYKLVRAQVSIFFSVIFLTLIWGRWRYGGHVLVSAVGWWIILSTLNLHTIAASFARSMLLDRGITNLRRRIIILTGLALVIGTAVAWSHSQWPPFPDNAGPDEFLGWFKQTLSVGATPYVLYPFRLVVRPYFAHDTLTFLHALAPALGVLALHYIVVVRADVAFEEASVEFSQKLAARVTAIADRRVRGAPPKKARRAPFNLNPVGWPPLAFLWKNLIQSGNF